MSSRRDVLHTPAPNPRARRAGAAPAAAPGAVPHVPARDQFNEFFRLPNENGGVPPAPAPAPTGEPTHGPTPIVPPHTQAQGVPTSSGSGNPDSISTSSPEDIRIQTSIWGGPITPGRFFASPLGAIPRYRNPTMTTRSAPRQASSSAGPSTRPVPVRTTPSDDYIRHPNSDLHPPSSTQPIGREPAVEPVPTADESETIISPSEATTPFSSNPPEIFRAMSSEGQEEGGGDSRKLAAEAAMRRLGLSGRATPLPTQSQSIKGKEKEKEQSSASTPSPAYHTPYLTPLVRSSPHPHPGAIGARRPWSKSAAAREGVDERLKTLKAVDDTIWGLVEELTRMKSLLEMDTEGEAEGHGENGHETSKGSEGSSVGELASDSSR